MPLLDLSSEAFHLPQASEGIMEWLRLVVMVEVMFIDKSGGCLSPMSRMSSAVGGKRRELFAGHVNRGTTGLGVGLSITFSRYD